jgi:hypothetical protein
MTRLTSCVALCCVLSFNGAAYAAVPRTFVSALSGNDMNACSRTAPCRGFAAAIAQTAPGGEVVVLDSGGYGTMVIDRPLSVIAPAGVHAAITASSGSAITIANGSSGNVNIRGLYLNSVGGTVGIDAQSGAVIDIDSCIVNGFVETGIRAARNTATSIGSFIIRNTRVMNGNPEAGPLNSIGILVSKYFDPYIEHCHISSYATGLVTSDASRLVIRETTFTNSWYGVMVLEDPSYSSYVVLDHCVFSQNKVGVVSTHFLNDGPQPWIGVFGSTFIQDETGLYAPDTAALFVVAGTRFVQVGCAALGTNILIRSGGDNIVEPTGCFNVAATMTRY